MRVPRQAATPREDDRPPIDLEAVLIGHDLEESFPLLVIEVLKSALAGGEYDELLDANRQEALTVGINAVPAHIFGRRYLMVGAQPDEVYEQVLRKLAPGGS